jgi:hypothetical protein
MDFSQDVLVYNALPKTVSVKALGNYFSFAPEQIKRMRGEIGHFLIQQKKEMGLVALPQEFEDPNYSQSEDGQRILAEKKVEGINNRSTHLQAQIYNLQHSLAQDLAQADMKVDAHAMATDGDLAAMEELLSYQRAQQDIAKERAEKARIKLRQLQATSNALVNKKD